MVDRAWKKWAPFVELPGLYRFDLYKRKRIEERRSFGAFHHERAWRSRGRSVDHAAWSARSASSCSMCVLSINLPSDFTSKLETNVCVRCTVHCV
jgi:hypothetical protein